MALCIYFKKCGGCSYQNVEYSQQLDNKKRYIANSLEFNDVKVFSGEPYYYRTRMDLIFHHSGIGLRMQGSWSSIIDIESCAIANKQLNLLLKEVRAFFIKPDFYDAQKFTGTLRYAVIRTPEHDSSISFVLNPKSTQIGDAIEKIKQFAQISSAQNILVTYTDPHRDVSVSDDYFVVKGSDMLKDSYLGISFLYSVQGFFQNNHFMAEKMLEYSKTLLSSYATHQATLLDLYGGVGCFGIINAGLFKDVTIVENSKQCIATAQKNIELNQIPNAKALFLDAQYIRRLPLQQPLFLITDPPRSGMNERTIQQIKKFKPKVIIYVSCNLQQLAKDVRKFKQYHLKSAALFDLFPQTPHCEIVAELVLRE